jgi:catechol 2,3-dioxygenase
MAHEAAAWGIAPPGHRVPGSSRPGVVRLQVAELSRSVAFYERVLGLAAETSEGAARLRTEDGTTLIELHERSGAAPVPTRGLLGLYHFAILLPGRRHLGRFVRHLAELRVRAGSADHLVSEALYLNDPDGLGIEVYADRPRANWRQRGRELLMAVDPLDVEALLDAAGGDRWTALPAGTVIGHVHLYVGELERAEAFYHTGLGLDKVVWSYPGALFLSAGGYHHHLGVNTWAVGARPAGPGDARLLDWSLVLPSSAAVEAAAEGLRRAGFATTDAGKERRAEDPWGTALRLIPAG